MRSISTSWANEQILVDCDVIQADGGTRTAAINGGYVALALAIKRLEQKKVIPAGVFKQQVAAVSVGIVDGKAMLDLDYQMDQKADVDMNVVMTARWSLCRSTGHSRRRTLPTPGTRCDVAARRTWGSRRFSNHRMRRWQRRRCNGSVRIVKLQVTGGQLHDAGDVINLYRRLLTTATHCTTSTTTNSRTHALLISSAPLLTASASLIESWRRTMIGWNADCL